VLARSPARVPAIHGPKTGAGSMLPIRGMFGYTNPEGDRRGLNPLLVKND
jgi:hypothetical protein